MHRDRTRKNQNTNNKKILIVSYSIEQMENCFVLQ
uniref:Uncharacterized protein n=1 Tax=Rhizophora mucronata TaxID=61149 RepID=A0A2P2R2Q3_RHIMU